MATNAREKFLDMVLPVACTNPASPASNDPVRFGLLTGVALTDEGEGQNVSTEASVDFGWNVYDLSVKGIDGSGNSAVAKGDAIFYVDADTPKLSKKSAGYFFGFALETVGSSLTATIKVLHVASPGAGTLGSGTVGAANLADSAVETAKIAANAVTADKLSVTLGKGFIPLDITSARIIAGDVIQNTVEGGVPDGNTAPTLTRVNGATDKALRITWAAAGVAEIQFAPIPKPPDLDGATDLEIHLMLAKDTNTNTAATIDVQIFDGVGDTEAGAATGALDTASLAEYSAAIAAAALAGHPGFLNVSLIPSAHANDAIYMYAAWVEYTRA